MDSTSEDRLLLARIEDAVRLCEKYSYPHFIGFLDERRQALAVPFCKRFDDVTPYVFGGYADAERVLLGVFPHFMQPDETLFPLTPLTFRFRQNATLSHRDFLGCMLHLGIRRDKIGDILCFPEKAVAFVDEDIAAFVQEQVTKVGGEGVTVTKGLDEPLAFSRQFQDIHMTVASARLDNVVKAITGLSREKAAACITGGLVSCNHQVQEQISKPVCEGDIISIRGYGRFRVRALSERTKKDRLILWAQKYL